VSVQLRDISIITNQLTANVILESWFVQNVLLQEIPFGLEWEIERTFDSVVIYLEVGELNADTIHSLKDRRNKVVLCQMGDEFLTKYNSDLYKECDFVFRNYYFSEIFEDAEVAAKTIWIPNGYKSGVGPRQPANFRKAHQRRFLAAFLGWLDNGASYGNERALFQAVAQKCPQDILLQPTSYFGKGFNVGMYSAVMEYSVFCPCPAGNSPETIRLYDALELGCIPISLRHPFLSSDLALGHPPFPLLDTWDELPALLAEYRTLMAHDPQSLVKIQEACIAWWTLIKATKSCDIAKRLLGLRS
jgi:hypothetical protein